MYCENGSAKEIKQLHNVNTRYLNQYILLSSLPTKKKKKKKREKRKAKKKEKLVVRKGFEHITQVLGVVCIYDTLVKFYSYTVFLLANHDFFVLFCFSL